jgi:rhamnulokinase
MAAARKLLAIDVGAESGRGILGRFDGSRVTLETVHRFPNGPVRLLDQLVWDAPGLYREILTAVRKAAADPGVDSVGVDTWGVDFGLIGRDGSLLGLPRHYRDPHTETAMAEAFAVVPRDEIYRRTGVQFLRFNTLYQLLALRRDGSPQFEAAKSLLFMPDLFHYWLTGNPVNEFTNASTSQMTDPCRRGWDQELCARFGLPGKLLGPIVPPGTALGPVRPSVAADTGGGAIPVVAPATHDTASAVAAVPASGENWAYLSSGTWSLLGVELPEPVVTDASLAANFTNEGGLGGTTRFLKNIMGLWLVQECKHSFERAGHRHSYDELARLAEAAEPFRSLIDPDDPSFLLPPDMPAAIAAFCRRTGQLEPDSPGAFVRCCLESLALQYRHVLELLERLTGRRVDVLHVVGGGCQNALFNQFTADAIQRPVLAGPVEATALGNVLAQALGHGWLASHDDVRAVVRRSVEIRTYQPESPDRWHDAGERYASALKNNGLPSRL